MAGRVMFGENETEPLLSFIAIESIGFIVNQANKILKIQSAILLK